MPGLDLRWPGASVLLGACLLSAFAGCHSHEPRTEEARERIDVATVRSDLRSLATAQELYYATNDGKYMPNGIATGSAPHSGYAPSPEVTVRVTNAGEGWTATATHSGLPGRTCAIFVNAPPVPPAKIEGEPLCD